MRKRQGFTIIELLVVMAIITILAALIFPVFAAAKEKNRQAKCMNNLKQLGTAFELYCQDYDSDWIAPAYLGKLYPNYVRSAELFICPSDNGIYNGRVAPPNSVVCWETTQGISSGTSYFYYPRIGAQWYTWPDMYGYSFADIPVAACHIHHLNAHERDFPILVLTKSTSIAKADAWWKVRMGPNQWYPPPTPAPEGP